MMTIRNRTRYRRVLAALTLLPLLLTACGGRSRDSRPTPGPEAIFTSAAETFVAQMATQLALASPTNTATLTPPPVPTLALPSALPTFAPIASSTPGVAEDKNCNNSAWIADITIPDKTKLDPGKKFDKTWLIQNTGTCTWTTSYKIAHVDGLDMGGSDTYVPLPVPPGQQVQMTVSMRAPTSPGDYYGRWMMHNEADKRFGSYLTVVIKVIPLEAVTP